MIQLNLVPDVKLELIKAQRHRNFVITGAIGVSIAAVSILVLVMIVWGGQLFYEKTLTDKISKLDNEFQNITDISKTVTVQNQLENIQETHDGKAMTSRMLDLVAEASAKGTDNSVSYNSFAIDTSAKTITLVAQTDKRGFEAADVFKKNIEGMQMFYVDGDPEKQPNEFKTEPETKRKDEHTVTIASDVTLSDLSYSEQDEDRRNTVSFRLTFKYDPILFDSTKDILRIRGINRGNVTDSYQRLPQSLFEKTTSNTGDTPK